MGKIKKVRKSSMEWVPAPDIKRRLFSISDKLGMSWVRKSRLFVYRSYNSKSRAYARTWGLPRVWQFSLRQPPAYVIEVLSERFDKLDASTQDKILIHELAHIPKNFSGSLLAHIRKRGKRNFEYRVGQLLKSLISKKNLD
jgi:predicted metallopeptidase